MNNPSHRPFIYIAGALSAGVFAARLIAVPFGAACLAAVVFLTAATVCSRRRHLATWMFLLAIGSLGMTAGMSRAYVPEDDIGHVARYYRKTPIELEGIIVSDVRERPSASASKETFTLKVRRAKAPWGWQARSGKVLVNLFRKDDLSYGDHLRLTGKLHRPYDFSSGRNFSYPRYLAGRGIRYVVSVKKDAPVKVLARGKGRVFKAVSLNIRDRLKSVLEKNLSPNEAGIMAAILLGDRSAIAKPIRALFVQTGTAHILAISGLHIGIVAALFLVIAKILPLSRRGQLFLVIILLSLYAFMTGGRPSVVRATVMAVVFLAGFIVEKEFDTVNTLCLAAAVILAANPLSLFDCGFQLSFTCVFAILYCDARMKAFGLRTAQGAKEKPGRPGREGWRAVVIQSLWLSLSIWVAVAGLIVYYFGMVTPIAIIANIIVVPLISVMVALGFGLLLSGLCVPVAAVLFAQCLKVVLNLMVAVIFLCDKIPFAHIYTREVKLGYILLYYAGVLLTVLILRHILASSPRKSG